jgi:hypothetical protein
MNKEEAKEILKIELEKFREKSYQELKNDLGKPITYGIKTPNGVEYQVEIEIFWDDKPDNNLRVMGAIDDGGFLSSIHPISDSFIISPSGNFIGE